MQEITDEAIVRFVDGAAAEAERARIEARLGQDPALAARVAAHRAMARRIAAAFGPPPEDAIDARLIARLGLAQDNVSAFAPRRRFAAGQASFARALRYGAIAASLAIGVLAGRTVLAPATGLALAPDGRLVASGALADGLSDRLAASPDGGPVRIGISFRSASGVCRTFRLDGGASGLACREDGRWVVPVMAAAGAAEPDQGDYRLAASDIAPAVMAEVDRRIVGDPLGPDEEARLRAQGWR